MSCLASNLYLQSMNLTDCFSLVSGRTRIGRLHKKLMMDGRFLIMNCKFPRHVTITCIQPPRGLKTPQTDKQSKIPLKFIYFPEPRYSWHSNDNHCCINIIIKKRFILYNSLKIVLAKKSKVFKWRQLI